MYTLAVFKGNAVSYIDAHCHIDFEVFDDDRQAMLERASAKGIGRFIIAGCRASATSETCGFGHPGMQCTMGLHPVYLSQLDETAVLEQLSRIESLLSELGE